MGGEISAVEHMAEINDQDSEYDDYGWNCTSDHPSRDELGAAGKYEQREPLSFERWDSSVDRQCAEEYTERGYTK